MPPEGIDEPGVARFDNAVKSMGCVLVTEPHFLAAELQTGFTRQQIIELVQYKVALEEAEPLPDGGHKFTNEECA